MKLLLKKRVVMALAFVLVLMVSFGACSGGGDTGNASAPVDAGSSAAGGSSDAASGSSSDAAAGEPVTLSFVTFLPNTNPQIAAYNAAYMDKLNEKANGELVMEWRGGPDTFNPMDMGEAVKSGAVDMALVVVGSYETIVPGVGGLMLSQLEPEEEMEVAYDYIEEMHNAGGLHFLMRGAVTTGNFFYTWLKNPVETPEDLQGMLIGSSTGGKPAVEAWGGSWTQVETNDSFTALEQGVADAIAGQPIGTATAQSFGEVAGYAIDHGYFKGTAVVIMNLDKWNSLPAHLQEMMTETANEAIQEIKSINDADLVTQRQALTDMGMEFIEFSAEDAERYVQMAYDKGWALQEEKYPDPTPGLRDVLTK